MFGQRQTAEQTIQSQPTRKLKTRKQTRETDMKQHVSFFGHQCSELQPSPIQTILESGLSKTALTVMFTCHNFPNCRDIFQDSPSRKLIVNAQSHAKML